MTDPAPTTMTLTRDVDEVTVKPHFDGQLTIVVSHSGYDMTRHARAVTVHGNGRIDYHEEALLGTPAVDRERLKAAIEKLRYAERRADTAEAKLDGISELCEQWRDRAGYGDIVHQILAALSTTRDA